MKNINTPKSRMGNINGQPKNKVFKVICFCFVIASFAFLFKLFFFPKVTFCGGKNIQIQVNSDYTDEGIKVTLFQKDISDKIETHNQVDTSKLGNYIITYQIPYLCFKLKYKRNVSVVDTTPPVIQLKDGVEYKLSYTKEYQEPGFQATDNFDDDLTDKVVTTREEISDTNFKINYSVTDSNNNVATITRNVMIIDDIKPNLTLKGSQIVNLTLGTKYVEQGATANDEKDGELTDKIEITGEVNVNQIGQYTIHYAVSDQSGNKSTLTRKVYVNSNQVKGESLIYLTFDDGPSSNITPKILDILKAKNVKATFFILNYSNENEFLVKRIVSEGHTIAMHGYSHNYKHIYQSEQNYMQNLRLLQEKIKKTTGITTWITRFPGGSSNTISKFNPGIMTRLTKLVVNEGFSYYDWNVSAEDAAGARNATEVYQNVVNYLRPNTRNFVLMHDFGSSTKTLNALPNIIDYGKSKGYTFSRIEQSTPMYTHRINN